LEKIDGYGIDIQEAELTMRQGMKWKELDIEKWHTTMAGIECVFMKEEETLFVITVYKNAGEK